MPPDSPVPAYLRRLLLSGDPAGHTLFNLWYALTTQALDQMGRAGIIRPAADPPVRAGFLLVNDLAVLLRGQITMVLGVDPLSAAGTARWAEWSSPSTATASSPRGRTHDECRDRHLRVG